GRRRPRVSSRVAPAATPLPTPESDEAQSGASVGFGERAVFRSPACRRAELADAVKRNTSGGVPEPHDVQRLYRPGQTFDGQESRLLDLQELLYLRQEPGRDQDLAGLGLPAETCGQVGHGADGAVVPAPLEADGADRGEPLGDADTEVKLVAPAV